MKQTIIKTVVILLVIGLFSLLFPWRMVSWGRITTEQDNVVVVSGYADQSSINQTATFSVGVNQTNADKQKAVDMVNNEIASIIEKVKSFGIEDKDIKTQSLSIYQNQEGYTDPATGAYRSKPGEWSAGNTIDIKYTFDNKEKVTDLTNLLASTGATNVWGPNFSIDNDQSMEAQKTLLDAAIKDAREKASIIAQSSGRKLGKVISVNENSSYGSPVMPMYDRAMGGGGGGYVEPGTSNISQTVTVVFELK
jgi:uncharacterized protein YggE